MDQATGPRAGGTPLGTILVVDDAPASCAALEEVCAAVPGCSVSSVNSALEAARILQSGEQSVCAVVTDIRMPRMDGFELIQLIRADPRHNGTPIIVVTADTDPETPERSSRLGADAFFAKPFSPAAIRRRLGELLDAKRFSR